VILRVRLKPIGKSSFPIPLCCLRCLPLVRPINDVDVARLENVFVMGHRDGDQALSRGDHYWNLRNHVR
jgi:hypothetical protein